MQCASDVAWDCYLVQLVHRPLVLGKQRACARACGRLVGLDPRLLRLSHDVRIAPVGTRIHVAVPGGDQRERRAAAHPKSGLFGSVKRAEVGFSALDGCSRPRFAVPSAGSAINTTTATRHGRSAVARK